MKKFLATLLSLTMVMALVACGATETPAPEASGDSPAPAPADPIVMMIGSTIADTSAQGMALLKFEELVEERTNGGIDVQLYLNSTLGDARQLCENVQMHTVTAGNTDGASASNFDSNYVACDLPFLFLSYEDAYKNIDGDFGAYLKASSKENGMMQLGNYWSNGFRNLSNNKVQVNSLADIQGMKIRVMEAPLYINVLKAWGANPTPMAFSEVYAALQQGTVDGQDNGPVLTYTNKFYEVQNYYTYLQYAYCISPLFVDQNWWNNLSPEYQEILETAANECCVFEREKEEALCDEYMQKMVDEGLIVNELSPEAKKEFQEVSIPVWDVAKESIDAELWDICMSIAGL